MNTPTPFGADDVLSRLLADSGEQSRLRDTLANLSAAPAPGEQPGEAAAIAAFRELVAEPAGIPSLAHRRRLRIAAAAASSVLVVVSGASAAAAAGALPGPAQDAAQSVLGIVGVHVPSSAGHSGKTPGPHTGKPSPSVTTPVGIVPPALLPPSLPTPSPQANPSVHPSGTPPTPGNSGESRHHGNPTPTASGHPTPGHGKPTTAPVTSQRNSPRTRPSSSSQGSSQGVTRRASRAIIR